MSSDPDNSGEVTHPCRLFVILAREAPRAVILRRGPTRWVQLIAWNLEDDTFEAGQWFKGRIYERRCDLSPDGRLFVYFANKLNRHTIFHSEYTYAWTAVSRPPYLTALALWPKGDCWHGGGLFEGGRTLWLNHHPFQAKPHPDHQPQGLQVVPNPGAQGEDAPIYHRRLLRDGWEQVQVGRYSYSYARGFQTEQTDIWRKLHPGDGRYLTMTHLEVNFQAYGGPYVLHFSVGEGDGGRQIDLPEDTTWADWDRRGRLLFAHGGRLYASEAAEFYPKALADFNGHVFAEMAAPGWATRWP